MPRVGMNGSLWFLHGERGGILVLVAAFMATAIALLTLVIDVGHWFEHRRHLQLQVDAGALAGGGFFNGCVSATAADRTSSGSAANTAIATEARKYAGDANNVSNAINAQINNRENVTVLLNSTDYASRGGRDYDDPAGPPCKSGYVDVKATDANVPWFFAPRFVPAINVHARVAIQQVTTLSGSLPLAVQDVNPVDAAAIFVNEDASNAVLATTKLAGIGARVLNGKSVLEFDNLASPVAVNVQSGHVGVVIALSGTASWSLAGSLATICGQFTVTCYATGSNPGLLLLHGYPTAGTGTPATPIVRDVWLYTQTATCTDASGPYFLANIPAAGCAVGVHAKIDFGCPAACGGGNLPPGAVVKVGNLGCPNSGPNPKGCPMTYNAATGYWDMVGTSYPTIQAASGANVVSLNWGTNAGGSGNTFTAVARPYAADNTSGPIQYARLTEAGASAQSRPYGTHNLAVAIGVAGNLDNAASASDPTVILRFASGAASNSGALDCDAGVNARDEIQFGCATPYQLNTGQTCPNSTVPANCIPTQTGNFTGPLQQGMNARFASCPANHWITGGSTLPVIQDGDPRLVPLIVTSYGAFANNGTNSVPVLNFGAFYITGWDQGSSGPCGTTGPPGNEPFPGPGTPSGDVWGHFMKYVGNWSGATSGGATCDFSAFGLCTTVLVQ